MSIIDWSDPEEMLGLLVDSVRDELMEERSDRERAKFLRSLSDALEALALQSPLPPDRILARLRIAAAAGPLEFRDDPALVHVHDCIRELERIVEEGPYRCQAQRL